MSKKRSVKQCGIRNHTTGVLNDNAYALLSLIVRLIMILPTLLGTIIATPVNRRIGDPMKTQRVMLLIEGIFCGLLYLLQIMGILQQSPLVLYVLMAIIGYVILRRYPIDNDLREKMKQEL